jgi:Holliday junction resolvase RusA-like endonuclease
LIKIKPLSVNKVYATKKNTRRQKSGEYRTYIRDMLLILPSGVKIPDGRMKIHILFNFSSKGSDIDNCVKPFLDILQKKYEFNDNRIYKTEVTKKIVGKGSEYIAFYIEEYLEEYAYIEWLVKKCGGYYEKK